MFNKTLALTPLTIALVSTGLLMSVGGCANSAASLTNPNVVSAIGQQQLLVSPNDQRAYRIIMLPNQLQVVLVSDPAAEKSAASLSVGVGWHQDPMEQQGLAHFLEHMLFMGTERYPDPAEYAAFVAENGGSLDASTSDITLYSVEVNNNAYDEALDRFSDFFKAPKFYPQYIDKERNAVHAEWQMRRDIPFFGMFELRGKLLGEEHPANSFVIGNLNSLSDKANSKLAEAVKAFYQQYYSANVMKLSLFSALPLDQMELMARQHFSAIKNTNISKPEISAKADFSQGPRRVHYVPLQDEKTLTLEFTIDNNTAEFAAKPNEFVRYLLRSEMPGTAAYQLKELGLVTEFDVAIEPGLYGNYGLFQISMQLTDQGMQQRESILAVVMKYLDLVKQQGVDQRYYNEIKTSLNNDFTFLENRQGAAYTGALSAAMQKVPAQHAVNAGFLFERFDQDAIKRVLAQLTPERLTVWYISKDEPTEHKLDYYENTYKISAIVADEVAQWQSAAVELSLPQVNRLMPESFALKHNEKMAKPQQVSAEAGIEAWLYPSQLFPEQPRGILLTQISNANMQKTAKQQVLLSLWQDMLNLQLSELSAEARVAGMYIRVFQKNGLLLQVAGFTDKQEILLTRLLQLVNATPQAEIFQRSQQRYIRQQQSIAAMMPYQQAASLVEKTITRGQFESASLVAAAQQLTVDDLQQFADAYLAENAIRLFGFGNYQQQDLASAAARIKASLPQNRKPVKFQATQYTQLMPGQILNVQRDVAQVSDVSVIDMHFHPIAGVQQRALALLIESHLRNQLFNQLRTEEQLGYVMHAGAVELDDYTGLLMLSQTPVLSAQAMQQRFERFKQEYAASLAALDQASFNQLKHTLLVGLTKPASNLDEEFSPIINDWFQLKTNFDSKAQLIAAVRAAELADVKAFYPKLIADDSSRIVIQLRGHSFAEQPFADYPQQQLVKDVAILSQ